MMLAVVFSKGMLIGFSIGAVVGPIGILCVRRCLFEGYASGIATGFGAAAAESSYSIIAAFGMTAVSDFMLHNAKLIASVGGIYLLYLGYTTFRLIPETQCSGVRTSGMLQAFATTFFLTLTNPVTILAFLAIFASFGFSSEMKRSAEELFELCSY